MGDDILAVKGHAIKCWVQQNVGLRMMWSPRVYQAKSRERRLGRSWLSPPLIEAYWCDSPEQVPLGVQRILNRSMLDNEQEVIIRISFLYVYTYLRVHLPLLGREKNLDVSP